MHFKYFLMKGHLLMPYDLGSIKFGSNGSWCMGIEGEMSGTVCVTFTWDMYIWVVYSFCLFCCLFIIITWWYVWCIEWASGNQEDVQACLVTLWLFIIPPPNEVWGGGGGVYWIHLVCLSVCPSVCRRHIQTQGYWNNVDITDVAIEDLISYQIMITHSFFHLEVSIQTKLISWSKLLYSPVWSLYIYILIQVWTTAHQARLIRPFRVITLERIWKTSSLSPLTWLPSEV